MRILKIVYFENHIPVYNLDTIVADTPESVSWYGIGWTIHDFIVNIKEWPSCCAQKVVDRMFRAPTLYTRVIYNRDTENFITLGIICEGKEIKVITYEGHPKWDYDIIKAR